jgi:ABC-type glycerol-3-phosphate transport system substrate-binding protein
VLAENRDHFVRQVDDALRSVLRRPDDVCRPVPLQLARHRQLSTEEVDVADLDCGRLALAESGESTQRDVRLEALARRDAGSVGALEQLANLLDRRDSHHSLALAAAINRSATAARKTDRTMTKRVLMIGGGRDLSAILAANPDLAGKVGTALMPAGPAGSRDTLAGGSHLVVFQKSDRQELANAFARHMISPDQVTPLTEQIDFLPGTVGGVERFVGGDDLDGVFGQQLVEHSHSCPAAGWWAEVEEAVVFPTVVQQLMQGQITAEEAAAQVDAAIEDAIA